MGVVIWVICRFCDVFGWLVFKLAVGWCDTLFVAVGAGFDLGGFPVVDLVSVLWVSVVLCWDWWFGGWFWVCLGILGFVGLI